RINNKKATVYLVLNQYSKNKAGKEKTSAKIKKIYAVTYNLNSGTNNKNNPESYTADTPTITLKNPTRKGYTFKGWYSDAKFKTKVTKIPKGSKGDKTLYAKWKK
ncbi:MAG: InlB B-repeat-containing protein, partial [Clostridia bacterium]|nr:InlB B-repeat-containing protein [Clostridia bacterium]